MNLDNDGIPAGLTFSQMVKDLFKVDLPGHEAPFLHAALGLSGEVAEIFGAASMTNIREECGDLEFYLEAAWQALLTHNINDETRAKSEQMRTQSLFLESSIHESHGALILIAGDIIDVAKKAWVYGKELNKKAAIDSLLAFEFNLNCLYYTLNFNRDEILRQNMVKLVGKSGRYATGKYSDAAAIARADKCPECGEPVSDTPSGKTCANGHGGAL